MADNGRVLLVDDDPAQRHLLRTVLEADGWAVSDADSGEAALVLLAERPETDVVLTDLMMPEMDGRALLRRILAKWPEIPVVILTAHGSVDSAVELLHEGAHHYLTKPTKLDELRITVRRAVEDTRTRRELARLRRRLRLPADVVGVSRQMQDVLETAVRVAASATPVLITGEPGTGKEVIARAIHAASGRSTFVALNCAALPPTQVEGELFGWVRGAFPDADRDHEGMVHTAHGGTLFIDELAEVPLAVHPKLLQLLDHGEYRRVGEGTAHTSQARLVVATSRDPEDQVEKGHLHRDLRERLDIIRIDLPPLRERPVDIPALAEHLLRRLAERYQLERAALATDALAALTSYQWPGNIRELENVLTRAMALRTGNLITGRDLPPHIGRPAITPRGAPGWELNPTLSLEEVERRYIQRVLEATQGNKLKAAAILGIDRSTLHRKLKQLQDSGDEPPVH